MVVLAGGERGAVRELRELRKTVEQLKAELAKAREDEARYRSKLLDFQRQLAEQEEEPEPESPSMEQLQAEWLAHPAGEVGPQDAAWARSIAEEDWEFLRKMNDRAVEDYSL